MSCDSRGSHKFHHDLGCELAAYSQADVANLTNDIGALAEQFNLLFLTKSHFAKPMGYFGRRCKLLNADRGSRPDLIQRTDKRLKTTVGLLRTIFRISHYSFSISEAFLMHKSSTVPQKRNGAIFFGRAVRRIQGWVTLVEVSRDSLPHRARRDRDRWSLLPHRRAGQ